MVTKKPDAVFKALADPTRRRILGLLRDASPTVGELASNFRTSRPAISRHVRQLRRAGLVVTRRRGTTTVCGLNAAPLRAVSEWVEAYEKYWSGQLGRLKDFVEKR